MGGRGKEEHLWDNVRKTKAQSNGITLPTPHSDFHSGPLEPWHDHKPVKPS